MSATWELPRPRRTDLAVAAITVAAGYYLAAQVGLAFTFPPHPISVLWPPNALLLAGLLLTPARLWWLMLAAALPAHLAAELQGGVPLAMVLGWFASNCSEALLGAACIRRFVPGPLRFDSFRDTGMFLTFGVLAAPIASSFLDAALVKLIGWGQGDYWYLVRMRGFSNVLAALTVVPLILTLAAYGRNAVRQPPRRYTETALLFLGLLAVCLLVFERHIVETGIAPALVYAPLPFLLWAAVRLGPLGLSSAIAALTVLAIWGAVHGLGPFVDAQPADSARAVQLFLIAVAVPLLLLAAALEERLQTSREAREQHRQLTHLSRVATLGELSGALAHELTQPLTAILSNAQAAQLLLADPRGDREELGEILSDIVAADRRASDVIQRVRAMFRKGEPHMQALEMNELAVEVLQLAHGDLMTRNVVVRREFGHGVPPVHGDRIQLQQVLINLVMNACEAMAAEPVEGRALTLRTAVSPDGGAQASVIDRGPGFPAGVHDKLFEPFYTTKPNGLGLGLSISRSIVAAHGGRLWGTSTPGNGATFHLVLPPRKT